MDTNQLFYALFEALPRQGPGLDSQTERAFNLLSPLPAHSRILELGCGTGMPTLKLAQLSGQKILAIDNHAPFLEILDQRAAAAGLGSQIETMEADMGDLPFLPGTFDLIWSEGAFYSVGFETGLENAWDLLRSGGCLAVTELVWFRNDPPDELKSFFEQEYPAIKSFRKNLELIRSLGFEILGHFPLPENAWTDHYYAPLAEELAKARIQYAHNPEAQPLFDHFQLEIDTFHTCSDYYGYAFFIMQKPA